MNQIRLLPQPVRLIHFGVFEVDLKAGELRKNGLKIKLQEQPFLDPQLVAGAGWRGRHTGRATPEVMVDGHLRRR